MRKAIVLAALIFAGAGAANAQNSMVGGTSISGTTGINSMGGLNARSSSRTTHQTYSAPAVNTSAKNDGEFIPSTYTNYADAVATGEKLLSEKPLTLGELARQVKEQKKAATAKPRTVIEQDEDGRIQMASRNP